MDFAYQSGVVVALLIAVYKLTLTSSVHNSWWIKNMKLVGMHYSSWRGELVPKEESAVKYIGYLFYTVGFMPIFSWLSVFIFMLDILTRLSFKLPQPDKLKEIQYKLHSGPLRKEQVISLLTETHLLRGLSREEARRAVWNNLKEELQDEFNKLVDDEIVDVELYSDEDGRCDITIDKEKSRVKLYGHSNNYEIVQESTREFKYEDGKLLWRTIERSHQSTGEESIQISDNVVMETEVRQNGSAIQEQVAHLRSEEVFAEELREELEDLYEEVEWHEVKDMRTKCIIMYHSKEFDRFSFRKMLQTEKQRTEKKFREASVSIEKLGGKVIETEIGYSISLDKTNDRLSKPEESELSELMSELERDRNSFKIKRYVTKEIDYWLQKTSKQTSLA